MSFDTQPAHVIYLGMRGAEYSTPCYGGYWSHWHGSLYYAQKSVALTHILTADEARHLNVIDFGWTEENAADLERWNLYAVGDLTERFFSKRSLIDAAITCWQVHFPDARFLVEGSATIADPQLVLAGLAATKDRINAIVAEFERLDGWNHRHKDTIARLCEEWERIWVREVQETG